jgi:hypothetical protein
VHRWWFDGSVWNAPSDADPQHGFRLRFRLPSYYRFSVDQMLVDAIMSESSETDVTTAVLKVVHCHRSRRPTPERGDLGSHERYVT